MEFFQKYLIVDWHYGKEGGSVDGFEGDVFYIAPATKGCVTGDMGPFEPRGECVFFDDGCKIHPVKPSECRFYDHTVPNEDVMEHRLEVLKDWKNSSMPEELLGRKPEPIEPSMCNLIEMMFKEIF